MGAHAPPPRTPAGEPARKKRGPKRAPHDQYRTTGSDDLSYDCPLDILAMAGAAALSGQRFSFSPRPGQGVASFPELTTDHVAIARGALRNRRRVARLDNGPLDFLRGSGQVGTLSAKLAYLAEAVADDDVLAYTLPRSALDCSLRLESRHICDATAAYRAQGSSPLERLSHPGRNFLAAYTLTLMDGREFYAVVAPHNFDWRFGADRLFLAPLIPMSFGQWLFCQRRRWTSPYIWPVYVTPGKNGKVMTLGHIESGWRDGSLTQTTPRTRRDHNPMLRLRPERLAAIEAATLRRREEKRQARKARSRGQPNQ